MVGHQEGVFAVDDVVGPGPDHVQHGLAPARGRVDPALEGVPGHCHGHLTGPQLVEGVALGRVALADVLGEGIDAARVTAGQGFEGTTGPHGVQLEVVAHDDGPGSRRLDGA